MKFRKHTAFYLITISIVVFLVLPFLLQDGMFMDGIQYACVSKNLANGSGTFWFPILSETWNMQDCKYFMEHPPLLYGIESIFFRIFGNTFYTERIFSFTMLLLTALSIHMIWQLLSKHFGQSKSTSWFPILLWIITPVCFWTFQNHMMETLLSPLTLLAVYFALKAALEKEKHVWFLMLSGILVFCSFLTKGLPGLFPIVTIPLFYITLKKISLTNALLYTTIVVFTVGITYLTLIFTNDNAEESLKFYLTKRLINRIEVTSTINYRFFILRDLFFEFLPSMLISLLLYFLSVKHKASSHLEKQDKKLFLFMLLLGFSASAPLMITMVQKNFYLVPSIPFFALALGFINTDFITKKTSLIVVNSKTLNILNISSTVMLISVFAFSFNQIGKISRDRNLINEVNIIGNYLKSEKTVSVDPDTYFSWSFQFYILRNYGIQLDPHDKTNKYFITKTFPGNTSQSQYKQINLGTDEFKLYELQY